MTENGAQGNGAAERGLNAANGSFADGAAGGRLCGVCGHPVRPSFRAPQPELAPDLDMRPGEPARSTLSRWLQTCRGCGAVAEDLTSLTAASRAIVESDAYRHLADSGSSVTLPFRRWALLLESDLAAAAEALLRAAWAADDAGAVEEAAALRLRVAALWGDRAFGALGLRRLDVLRRAGAMPAADAWARTLFGAAPDELGQSIIAYQHRLISAGDTGRHLISSALPPPAHKPHVSHGKRAERGLFARLFGRR